VKHTKIPIDFLQVGERAAVLSLDAPCAPYYVPTFRISTKPAREGEI
jgi:hypothetical protein